MDCDNATTAFRKSGGARALIASFPLMIIYAMGFMSATYLPVWASVIATRYGIPLVRIGFVGSLELGAVALASILTAAFLDTRHRRWPVAVGLLVSVGANLLAAVSPSVGEFALARVVVGLANGFLLADVNRRAAHSEVPSRVFAGQLFIMALLAAVFFGTAPRMIADWGAGAPFFYCAAVGGAALLSASWLPVSRRAVTKQAAKAPSRFSLAAALMLGAATLIFITMNGVWPYISAAAPGAGVSLAGLSILLAVGAVLNLAAPMISGWSANGRVSPALALTVGVGAVAVTVFFLTGVKNAMLFGAGVLFLPFFVMFVIPFYLDFLVRLDESGKCVAASAAFIAVGFAIGPVAGGVVMEHAGVTGLTVAGEAAMLLTLLATWLVLVRRPKVAVTVDAKPGDFGDETLPGVKNVGNDPR